MAIETTTHDFNPWIAPALALRFLVSTPAMLLQGFQIVSPTTFTINWLPWPFRTSICIPFPPPSHVLDPSTRSWCSIHVFFLSQQMSPYQYQNRNCSMLQIFHFLWLNPRLICLLDMFEPEMDVSNLSCVAGFCKF